MCARILKSGTLAVPQKICHEKNKESRYFCTTLLPAEGISGTDFINMPKKTVKK